MCPRHPWKMMMSGYEYPLRENYNAFVDFTNIHLAEWIYRDTDKRT